MKGLIKFSKKDFSKESISKIYELVEKDNDLCRVYTTISDIEQSFQRVKSIN